jgi:8-oxo-dGTP pyrophosphatase MutT (NUDIX family)
LSHLFDQLRRQLIHGLPALGVSPQAAVLVLITLGEDPAILYTKRASHLRQHPGEVCFPGGMWEQADADLLVTAQREVFEEIGLEAADIHILGRLPLAHTRAGIPVTPFVATFDPRIVLTPSPAELDSIFLVPIRNFHAGIQVRIDTFERQSGVFHVPAYHYQGYDIWGLTAAVTAQLLALSILEA